MQSRRDDAVRSPVNPVGISGEKPMWVLAAPDVYPFSKAGGISDYVHSFAMALRRAGIRVEIYSPYYERLMLDEFHQLNPARRPDSISFRGRMTEYEIYTAEREGLVYHFVRQPEYYGHDSIYVREGRYNLNLTHFSFMGKTMLRDLKIRFEAMPAGRLVLQGNDVYASLFGAYLDRADFPRHEVVSLFCIHNLGPGYIAERAFYDYYSMDPELKSRLGDSFGDKPSWCEALLPFFDKMMTVSDTYAEELAEGPDSIHALLKERRAKGEFRGFLNGIDNRFWSIRASPWLAAGRERESVEEIKRRCKKRLCASLELDARKPLFGFVGRICEQKGLETLGNLLQACQEMQLVILGEGEPLDRFIPSVPAGRLVHLEHYEEAVCHELLAAADYVLVPSRYEPCGLVAMYAARFGAVPIVRRTGGLNEIADRIRQSIGWSLSFEDDQECVRQVGRMLSETDEPSAVPGAANALAEIEWDWETSVDAVMRYAGARR
ncbi:glycosyltransferase [Paenibacillaceae bacterium WGS1546]|uniref:glycosyltransferase n=1 Tax=Cohnella sp. WGS1546 TaxID=3366810 RepID=UPI00372D7F97